MRSSCCCGPSGRATYVTQVTAPTLTNDLRGAFLARSLGARTIAFGTHVTPLPRQTMEAFPTLDYVLRGEPELTLRELVDTLEEDEGGGRRTKDGEGRTKDERRRTEEGGQEDGGRRTKDEGRQRDAELAARLEKMYREADPEWRPPSDLALTRTLNVEPRTPNLEANPNPEPRTPLPHSGIGLARCRGQIRVNADRPFIRNLDDLPLPRHDLLPLGPVPGAEIRGPYSLSCPAAAARRVAPFASSM